MKVNFVRKYFFKKKIKNLPPKGKQQNLAKILHSVEFLEGY